MEAKQPCSPHGWTLDTLEKYLSDLLKALRDQVNEQDKRNLERFTSAKEAVGAALAAADKALSKAETASEKRFEAVNEFRQTLADQATLLMPRAEYTVQHQALNAKVDELNRRIAGTLTSETFNSTVKSILDRFEAINNLTSANASRITSIEVALRTKTESSATGITTIVAIVSVIYGVMATIGVVVTVLMRH